MVFLEMLGGSFDMWSSIAFQFPLSISSKLSTHRAKVMELTGWVECRAASIMSPDVQYIVVQKKSNFSERSPDSSYIQALPKLIVLSKI